jgi:hypothetical protein
MQQIFNIHAGEYLVGSYIEENFKDYNVWVPSKDTGVDLLVTNSKNNKAVSLQVKYSKDYVITHMAPEYQNKFRAFGWWTLRRDRIKKSKADLWVFVMQSFVGKTIECVVLSPSTLLMILKRIHGNEEPFQVYMWVGCNNKCWETRGLNKAEILLIASDRFKCANRNLTSFLGNWKPMKQKLC